MFLCLQDLNVQRRSTPAKSALKFDDENKENVPPQTSDSGGFSSSRPFTAGRYTPRSLGAKKQSFAATVTERNLAEPPLKLPVRKLEFVTRVVARDLN